MSQAIADHLDAVPEADLRDALRRCCGSEAWIDGMIAARPFRDDASLVARAENVWFGLTAEDWLEAASCHPRIGDRAAGWSKSEQSGMADADEAVRAELIAKNREYEERFGFVFLICATGLSAEEMLASLRTRLDHDRDRELRHLAEEQAKITHLRLQKLVAS